MLNTGAKGFGTKPRHRMVDKMTDRKLFPVFDGHNDVLLRLFRQTDGQVNGPKSDDAMIRFFAGENVGHLDWPRMRKGGFAGGMFAIYVPSQSEDPQGAEKWMTQAEYDVPLPPPLPFAYAQDVTLRMAALLLRLERDSQGRLALCRTRCEIDAAMAAGRVAMVMHIEGAEGIDPDFVMLDVLHAAGLRSIGPVWSRPTLFGHGVPFRFPATPDTGPGLTELGKGLVRHCNKLKIMIDLSHLNGKGFWDVAEISDAPLIATHSNAHAVCPHSRNLTDDQLRAIRDSKGMVGLNYATCFLRPDGQQNLDTPVEDMLRHLDHLIAVLGVDHVGLGSDFDGATIPAFIDDAAGLPRLTAAMRRHGYDDVTMAKLCHGNWLDVLERVLGE